MERREKCFPEVTESENYLIIVLRIILISMKKLATALIIFSIASRLLANETSFGPLFAIEDLYGITNTTEGKARTAKDKLTSVWFKQSFKAGKEDLHVVFTKTQQIDIQSGNIADCHICSVEIGAITYKQIGNQWQTISKQPKFAEGGSWGDLPAIKQAKMLQLSKKTIAFLIDESYLSFGVEDKWVNLFVFNKNKWLEPSRILLHSDNSGICEEIKNNCYSYNGKISVIPHKNYEYSELLVTYTGTELDYNTGKIVPVKNLSFVFNGNKYEPKTDSLNRSVSIVKAEDKDSSVFQDSQSEKNENITELKDNVKAKEKVSSYSLNSLDKNDSSKIFTRSNLNHNIFIGLLFFILSVTITLKAIKEHNSLKKTKTFSFIFIILIFIFVLVISYSFYINEPESDGLISKVEEVPNKPWEPTAFILNTDHLPSNYIGLDPKQFLELFKSKIVTGRLNKDEFETTEEFIKRTADKDAILAPISTSSFYAFRIDAFPIKYNADNETYTIGGDYSGCKSIESRSHENLNEDWFICRIAKVTSINDTYIGSNALGVSASISRTITRYFSLAIKSNLLLTPAFSYDQTSEIYKYHDTFSVNLEKARSLRTMNIAVLFVGQINDAKIIAGKGYRHTPTIDNPTDITEIEDAVPFNLKKVYYYVIETGEILGNRDFS